VCVLPQYALQLLQTHFDSQARLCKEAAKAAMRPGQTYKPVVADGAFKEMMLAFEATVELSIDIRALVRDIRRLEIADAMALSAF
jgi:hypothetical protein